MAHIYDITKYKKSFTDHHINGYLVKEVSKMEFMKFLGSFSLHYLEPKSKTRLGDCHLITYYTDSSIKDLAKGITGPIPIAFIIKEKFLFITLRSFYYIRREEENRWN